MTYPLASPKAPKYTAIIAQPSNMDCQLLASAIERQCRLDVLSCVTDSGNLTSAMREKQPDLLLVSPRLQDGALAGLRATKSLKGCAIHSKTVVLLDVDDRELVIESFRCGASGVFTRSDSSQQLCKCVNAVLQGQIWASNVQFRYVVEALSDTPVSAAVSLKSLRSLSKREDEIVALVASGLSNRDVAARLNLNENTVKNYISGIFQKTGVSSRVELVLQFVSEHAARTEAGATENSREKFGT